MQQWRKHPDAENFINYAINSSLEESLGTLAQSTPALENRLIKIALDAFTYERNFDLNGMKPCLISMKSFHCYDKDRIVISGKWTSDSLKNAITLIDLEKAWDELFNLDMVVGQDSIFEDKKFNKKFPKLDETYDPEYIRNAIIYIKNVRGL